MQQFGRIANVNPEIVPQSVAQSQVTLLCVPDTNFRWILMFIRQLWWLTHSKGKKLTLCGDKCTNIC